jgi:hypothetical protein
MKKFKWSTKLGIILMVVSVPVFLFIPIIPFLNVDNIEKVKITTITFIVAEILFWSGGVLVGKELFSKYKSYFNPLNWFKKKQE